MSHTLHTVQSTKVLLGGPPCFPQLRLPFPQAPYEAPHSIPTLTSVLLVLLLSSCFAHGAGKARPERPDLFSRQQEENQTHPNLVYDDHHVSALCNVCCVAKDKHSVSVGFGFLQSVFDFL